ncbi:MAG: Uncharacterised protein [Marine Group II euryarchaeote MED-G33]|nr:MAG: Uncharacterised protein [Marine Group II euryarchaeote MED-G33]
MTEATSPLLAVAESPAAKVVMSATKSSLNVPLSSTQAIRDRVSVIQMAAGAS